MATRLTKLRLNEISGVDDPANEQPGWIVAKSREFKTEIEDLERSVVALHELLASRDLDVYLDDAPAEVTKAREELIGHIAKDLEDDEEQEVSGKVIDKIRNLFGVEKSGNPIQPIVGAPAQTREEVDRVTPAEIVGRHTTEDQGSDELGRDEEGNQVAPPVSGAHEPDDGQIAGRANQPIIGAPGETREEVDRVTPAETSSSSEDRVTEDQGADELGRDDEGNQVAPPVTQPEELKKALRDELEPLREAMGAVVERIEDLEKAAARQTGLPGQDFGHYEDDSLAGAFRKAAHGQKVTLR
jgi:hypothetical protein